MSKTRKITGAVVAAILLGTAATPVAAGFLDRLFGGFTRRIPVPDLNDLPRLSPIPDRIAPQGRDDWQPRSRGGGPRMAYCVRTCDGHFFPVHPHQGFSAAQMCSAFCPGSETRIYAGSGIDHAVGTDGRRYSELPQAYAYRKQLVKGCTCNGRDAFGVARIDPETDPTLQRGDVLATRDGMMVVTGSTENGPQFTSAGQYRGLSERHRQQLVNMEITPGRRVPQTEGRAPSDR